MCLMPFGGAGNILIPPTDHARKLADYLRVGIVLHLCLAIYLMIGSRYMDGVLDFIGVFCGWMAIRNRDGYSFQCTLSYLVFGGMDVFWSVLRLILFFAGAGGAVDPDTVDGLSTWRYYVLVSGFVISPFIYTFVTVTAYYLYKELKRLVDESNGGGMGDQDGGGGYAVQNDVPPAASSGSVQGGSSFGMARETHPAPGGFKAFTGTGNRLGGS